MEIHHHELPSKFLMPKLSDTFLQRQRLLSLLNDFKQKKVTLVSAPPGYGKTIAIVQWIKTLSYEKTIWISLDSYDNSKFIFFQSILTALENIYPGMFSSIQSYLEGKPEIQSKEIIIRILSVLHSLSDYIILVFDDYHTIEELEIHDAIHFFIKHKPETVHLCIISRSDPPMPLGRLRAADDLIEIRQKQLTFSKDETKQFFNKLNYSYYSDTDLLELHTISEGWITALRLVMLTIHDSIHLAVILRKLKGIDRTVEDYLLEEVFAGLPVEIQTFLIKTSILEVLIPDLCDQIIGNNQSFEILSTLEKNNLFIVTIGENRAQFRYHRLFKDYLYRYLLKKQPDIINHLHMCAYNWFSERNDYYHALFHCLQLKDPEIAIQYIERITSQTWNIIFSKHINSWIMSLSDNLIIQYPNLALYRARMALRSSIPEDALKFAQIAEHRMEAHSTILHGDKNEFIGRILLIKSSAQLLKGNIFKSLEYSQNALSLFNEHRVVFRTIAISTIGALQIWIGKGDLHKAIATFDSGIYPARRTKQIYFESVCAFQKAIVLKYLGLLHDARDLLNELLPKLEPFKASYPGIYGNIKCELADIVQEQGDNNTAHSLVEEGLETTELSLEPLKIWWSTWCAARIQFYIKKYDTASLLLDSLNRISFSAAIPFWFNSMSHALRANTYLLQHRIDDAENVFKENNISHHTPLTHANEIILMAYCRYLLHIESYEQCKFIIEQLISTMQEKGRNNNLLETLILQSVLSIRLHKIDHARNIVKKALELGYPQKYIRLFRNESSIYTILSELAHKEKNHTIISYIKTLVINTTPDDSIRCKERYELTEREIEILQMVSHGYSNFELADKMYISINTVKTHLKKINEKLGTSSRTQAVAEARSLEIIT